MTAEEHLKADLGAHLASAMFQIALLKADCEALRERVRTLEADRARDGAPA